MSDQPFLLTVQQHIMQEQRRRYPARQRRIFLAIVRHHAGRQDHRIEGPPRRSGRYAGQRRTHQCAGRNAAETRCPRQPGPALLPGCARQCRRHGVRGERTSRSSSIAIANTANTSSSSIRSTAPAISMSMSASAPFSRSCARPEDPDGSRDPLADVLQPGVKQVAAGYVVYGSSTHVGLHHRQWRPRLHARSRHRRLHHQPRAHHHAGAGQPVLHQRSQ